MNNTYPVNTGQDSTEQEGDQGSFEDPGVRMASGSYTYRVHAFNSDGVPTNWSTTQSGALPEGTAPSASATPTDTSMTFTWTGTAAAIDKATIRG